ncbi:MAG: glycosyltransferase family 4 protein [Candidatus Rokuibacteriota bacterium]
MIRVLHLVTWLEPGGLETWLLSMLKEIPSDKVRMDFCCKGPSVGALAAIARQGGARVLHCPLRPDHVGFVRGVGKVIRDGGYDVLHNHLEAYSGVGAWVGRRQGLPVISSFHNTEFAPQTWTRSPGLRGLRAAYARVSRRCAVKWSRYVTGCSRAVLNRVAPGLEAGPGGRVLPYGVRPGSRAGESNRAALRHEMGWPREAAVVVHIGRMVEQKNHEGVLAVFGRVIGAMPRARLLCVGDGPLRPSIERRIARDGLSGYARCVGIRGDAIELLRGSDVLLLPSRHEGLPLVALEAGAVGVPVVGSDIPGLDEIVRHGETGALHVVDDVEGMARSVVSLLADRARADRLGEAGRRWVSERFSVRASADRLEGLYRECIGLG